MPNLHGTVRSFAEEALRLSHSLAKADAIQWEAAPIPRPSDDTTQRAKGGHGDPTPSIALDERRLAVRAQYDAAASVLVMAQATVAAARRDLDAAIDAWEGGDPR